MIHFGDIIKSDYSRKNYGKILIKWTIEKAKELGYKKIILKTYKENISLDVPGEYYFVAKAKVDHIYKNVIHTDEYGDESYLRIVHERTNESYYEEINGTDGLEVVKGQLWWYSPIIHVTIIPETGSPDKTIINGPSFGKPEKEYTFSFGLDLR